MNNPYKFGITLLIIAGIGLVLGFVLFFINFTIGLLMLAASVVLGLSGYSVLKRYVAAVRAQEKTETARREAAKDSGDISLPSELNWNGQHYVLRYSYNHVDVAYPSSQDYASAGDWVSLEPEPKNPHNNQAVRLELDNGRTLGYLYSGKLQDMANDFIRRRLPIVGIVEDDSATSILLGFYKKEG